MTTLLTPFLAVWERRSGCILLAVVLMVGCGGESGVSGPPVGGGTELRPGLTLRVGVAPEAASVAQALGWTGGVPGAEVRVHRFGTDFAWETATTDAQGVARLPDLISGRYRVAVYRPLTEAESAQTGVGALAGGRELNISAGGTENTLEVIGNQPGSLVISEVYGTSPFVAETIYDFHMFFELYNNSDQTVFLDGLTFGTTLGIPQISSGSLTCADTEPFRKDPGGIWAHFLHRFPGSGAEFPLAPGGVAVVALDAVDHSTVDSRFPDMSHADFELFGSADVDNPDVPNVVEIGVEPFQLGHGLRFFIAHALFIARRVDPAALESQVLRAAADETILLVPASDLIDVVWTTPDGAFNEQRFDRCDGPVHAIFDQLGGGFVQHGVDLEFSVQRILLPGSGGGRLQDTNVSAVDLVRARFTPGSVP